MTSVTFSITIGFIYLKKKTLIQLFNYLFGRSESYIHLVETFINDFSVYLKYTGYTYFFFVNFM